VLVVAPYVAISNFLVREVWKEAGSDNNKSDGGISINTKIITRRFAHKSCADSSLWCLLLLCLFVAQSAQSMHAADELELEDMASRVRSRVQLSEEEKNWLASKPKINARVGDYLPFHLEANGLPQGLGVDYMHTFCIAYSMDCNFVAGLIVTQSVQLMKKPRGIAVQPGWHLNAEWERVAIFSKPYVSSPFVIFKRKSNELIAGMDDLVGKRVVVEKGYAIHRIADFLPR